MIRRVLIIINPASGQKDNAALCASIGAALERQGIAYELYWTRGAGDARRRARQATGYDALVAAGGDGTIMEVVSGLIDAASPLPLLQLPLGTANLLAVAFAVPRDIAGALALLTRGRVVEVDALYLVQQQLYSVLLTGAGWDAQLIRDASREIKNRLGFAAYLWSGVKNLFRLKRAHVTLTIDGERQQLWAHTVLFANSGAILGPALRLGKDISPHDGALDVIALTPVSPWGMLGLVWRLLRRDFRSDRNLRYWRGRRVRLEASPPLAVQVDGEPLGQTPLELEVVPAAVRLIVPESYRPH